MFRDCFKRDIYPGDYILVNMYGEVDTPFIVAYKDEDGQIRDGSDKCDALCLYAQLLNQTVYKISPAELSTEFITNFVNNKYTFNMIKDNAVINYNKNVDNYGRKLSVGDIILYKISPDKLHYGMVIGLRQMLSDRGKIEHFYSNLKVDNPSEDIVYYFHTKMKYHPQLSVIARKDDGGDKLGKVYLNNKTNSCVILFNSVNPVIVHRDREYSLGNHSNICIHFRMNKMNTLKFVESVLKTSTSPIELLEKALYFKSPEDDLVYFFTHKEDYVNMFKYSDIDTTGLCLSFLRNLSNYFVYENSIKLSSYTRYIGKVDMKGLVYHYKNGFYSVNLNFK